MAMAELAGRQHGVVATWQLRRLGLTYNAIHRRVIALRLQRLYRGVYAVGHDAVGPSGQELAAVMSCGPDAVSSHRSAGCRHGFLRSATRFEVTAPRSRAGPDGVL